MHSLYYHQWVCRLFTHSVRLSWLTGPFHLTMEKQSRLLLNKKDLWKELLPQNPLWCFFFLLSFVSWWQMEKGLCVDKDVFQCRTNLISRSDNGTMFLSHLMESLLAGSQRRVHFREFTSQYDMIPKVNSSLHTKLLQMFQCSRWGYSSISLILSRLKFFFLHE